MRVLVSGLHRSGTSATAKYLAAVSGLSFLDDPEWAIFDPVMGSAYKTNKAYKEELLAHEIVKCPRMIEFIDDILNDFLNTNVVYMVRDPRDIYCSISEAQNSPHPSVSTMMQNQRFGQYSSNEEGFILSFNHYAKKVLDAINKHRSRIHFVSYSSLYLKPQETIERICKSLEIKICNPFPADMVTHQLAPIRNKVPGDLTIKGIDRWKRDIDLSLSNKIYLQCGRSYELLLNLIY